MVELMIVVAIIAIIVGLALPSYTRYTLRANRTEAIDAILAIAACQERVFTKTNAYAANQCDSTRSIRGGRYTLGINVANAGQTFTITATAGSGQSGDKCANLTFTSTGVKGVSGSQSAESCWAGR